METNLEDVFDRAETALGLMGNSGGGRALAQFISALADPMGATFQFGTLAVLDSENRQLAKALFSDWLDGAHTYAQWECLKFESQHFANLDQENSRE